MNREYRRLATGWCFFTFMVTGLLWSLTLFPLIYLASIPRRWKREAALFLIQRGFRLFVRYMCFFRVIRRFEVSGLERVRQGGPYLVIANHPTLIDVVAVVGMLPHCNCIVKNALWRNPFMGIGLRAAGFIPNNHPDQLMRDCDRSFHIGRSLMIFPEGTRSPRGGLRSFNRGAAHIAARMDVPVVPVVIRCDPPTLLKHEPWYRVPPRAVDFTLEFQEPLQIPREIRNEENTPLRVRALNRLFESHFRTQLDLPEEPAD